MIHYSLVCDKSHKFDGWFASAAAYDGQKSRGLVTCPICLTQHRRQGADGAVGQP